MPGRIRSARHRSASPELTICGAVERGQGSTLCQDAPGPHPTRFHSKGATIKFRDLYLENDSGLGERRMPMIRNDIAAGLAETSLLKNGAQWLSLCNA